MSRRGESVYHRKDGLWEARYVKEIDISGKKKYGSVYAHSYKEAKAKRQDVLDHILLYQKVPMVRRITVADLATEWLLINRCRLKPSSHRRYLGFYKKHIEPIIGSALVLNLTTVCIHHFAMDRLAAGLSPQSVNALLTMLRSILKYGNRQYKLPLPEIMYLNCEKKEMRVLSPDEQKLLSEVLMKDLDIYKLSVLVALYTGLRIGELCALKWTDIDTDSIHVRRTVQRLKKENGPGTELIVGDPKTKTSNRIIPIPSFLQELLSIFRENAPGTTYFLACQKTDMVEPRVLQYKFKQYLKAAGIENATFHTLRHTFATRCIECGFEVKSLSEILGHANVQLTLNRYVHSSFALKQANMELLKQVW